MQPLDELKLAFSWCNYAVELLYYTNYRPLTNLREGNVFTHAACPPVGVCASQHAPGKGVWVSGGWGYQGGVCVQGVWDVGELGRRRVAVRNSHWAVVMHPTGCATYRSLNFCPCTTWFLDLDDLVRINRASLHKDSKVSVLQPNACLAQLVWCWTLKQVIIPCIRLSPTGGNFFWFS